MEIVIGNHTYIVEKSKINLDKFDHEGSCDEYDGKSYVIIDDDEPRVRILNGIFDDNNHGRYPFDPQNYSTACVRARLEHGDETDIKSLYKILSTTNITGEIYYDYLDRSSEDWNSEWTFGFENGIAIHEDLKNLK